MPNPKVIARKAPVYFQPLPGGRDSIVTFAAAYRSVNCQSFCEFSPRCVKIRKKDEK